MARQISTPSELDRQVGRYLEERPPTLNDVTSFVVTHAGSNSIPCMTLTFYIDGDVFAACGAPQETEQENG